VRGRGGERGTHLGETISLRRRELLQNVLDDFCQTRLVESSHMRLPHDLRYSNALDVEV
jgi:hypothetical protein